MVGRADKGLVISTGGFTLEARREATRDGAPPIDLIDGRLLAEKLKELKLGVRTTVIEHVEVVEEWFRSFERHESGCGGKPAEPGGSIGP